MKKLFVTVTILLSIFSCTKVEQETILTQDTMIENVYDAQVYELAKAINLAINNNGDFRNLIKDEVLKQFDGDYDLLMTTAFEKKVSPSQDILTKSSSSKSISVKEMLSHYCAETKSSGNILDELVEKYPELQVSIPVHAEEWDSENYVPAIAIVPSDYEEFVTETVPGINADGEIIEIDAINPPDKPVIVIGLNERVSPCVVNPNPEVTTPTATLLAQYSLDRVQVSVTISNLPSTASVQTIKLYRTGANNNTFSFLTNMVLNYIYYDWNIADNKQYSYYAVVNYTNNGVLGSVQTNLVTLSTINTLPNPISNLKVTSEYATKNHIEWNNPATNNFETQIYKTTPNTTLELIATLQSSQTEYYDEPVIPGEKWIYSVKKHNPNTDEVSLHQQKYIYNPYRNPSEKSPVIMKEIYVGPSAESWLDGKPEVIISVYGQKFDAATNDIVVTDLGGIGGIPFYFPTNSNLQTGLNVQLAEWSFFDDSTYYPILNINVREIDRASADINLSLSAKCGYKYADNIDLAACGNFDITINKKNKDCGIVYLRYFENPEQYLNFGSHGTYMRISESDNLNP